MISPEINTPKCTIQNPCITQKTLVILCKIARRNINLKHSCSICSKGKEVEFSKPILPEEPNISNDDIMEEVVSNDEISDKDIKMKEVDQKKTAE